MKAQISIDWCTFSVKDCPVDKVIRDYLGMDPAFFRDESFAIMGFQNMKVCNHIMVCYNPRENEFFKNQGVCVSMSGSGCRAFETLSTFARGTDTHGMKNSAFPVLFSLLGAGIHDKVCNVSRIDLACDDKAGSLDMETIVYKVQANEINSRIAKRTVMQQFDGKDRSGATVYLGSPSSDCRVRIYDKALEQCTDEHWIRCELVLRSKHAVNFVHAFNTADRVGTLAALIVNGKFSFIEMDDSNISRCSVCDWWAAFIDDLESLQLVSRETMQHSVERTVDWLRLQVSPSLAVVLKTFGFSALWEMAKEGEDRLSGSQLALIDDYNSLRAFNRSAVAAL